MCLRAKGLGFRVTGLLKAMMQLAVAATMLRHVFDVQAVRYSQGGDMIQYWVDEYLIWDTAVPNLKKEYVLVLNNG